MMYYQERPDGDTKLIKFHDVREDAEECDCITYVKFRYDLSRRQIELIEEAAGDIEYDGEVTFEMWIESVIDKAESSNEWYDKKGQWDFWNPYPCLSIEV